MKRCRFIIALFVALFVLQGAMAQRKTKSVVETDSTTIITTVRIVPKFSPKHDLRIGVGALGVVTSLIFDGGWGSLDSYYPDFRRDMAECNNYRTPRVFVGNYSLSYTYQDRRWLQYGCTVTFGATTCWRKDVTTGQKVENLSYYALSVLPTVRFNWFYREKVQLYSSIALGIGTDFEEAFIFGDVTFVGCSFGRKLFGFAEIGGGMGGSVRVGLGYRFNADKK